jgi:hypothetical protein
MSAVLDENGLPFFVSKYTRAPQIGREIVCPCCSDKVRVYHFSWFALVCDKCQEPVKKVNWVVALTDKEKYTGKTSIFGNGIVMKEVNTKMIHDAQCYINTSDYPDFCDSYFEEATWVDGTALTDEELECLQDTGDGSYLYSCIEAQLY